MSDKPEDQVKLEAAVSKVAKAYEELVRVIERGSTIEGKHVSKAFGFLASVGSDCHSKAGLSIKTALAANGGFSLDKEYEAPAEVIPTATRHSARPERVVGDGSGKPKNVVDPDDIEFLDET